VPLYDGIMRFGLLLCLAIASTADLKQEDLRSVQAAFRKTDATLDRFIAVEKKQLDVATSMMLVRASPGRPPMPEKIGAFVVSGPSNRVRLVIDVFPQNELDGFPTLDQPRANSVELHFYSDYGMYHGSIKYFYDLSSGKPPLKFRYGMLALTSSSIRNGSLVYTGASLGRGSRVTIEPRPNDELPAYRIVDAPTSEPDAVPQPVPMQLPDARSVLIMNTPPGQSHRPAGISVTSRSGTAEFYPAPVPTMALQRKLRPTEQAPLEIENNIGPFVKVGSTIWFTNSFYDGEGVSGVGAIGAFDLRTHKFDMRYLPEIAPWSGPALRFDGENLWIGLMRQPEGAAYGGGLLRYDPRTGAAAKFKIPDYIYTIDRLGDTIYCGTANGLYLVRGGEVTQMRFEPDAGGKIAVTRTSFPRYTQR
jgi:hypothetical protein